jgi:hypothetical protein
MVMGPDGARTQERLYTVLGRNSRNVLDWTGVLSSQSEEQEIGVRWPPAWKLSWLVSEL